MPQSDMARSGATSPLGKLTSEIPKIKIADATFDALQIEARKAGLSVSEFVRELVVVRVHGLSHALSFHEARLKAVAGIGVEMEGGE